MRTERTVYHPLSGWKPTESELAQASLVIYFGTR